MLVPRSPVEIFYSFIYDEILRLSKRGIEVHVARYKTEGSGKFSDIYFYDIPRRVEPSVFADLHLIKEYPIISLIRGPRGLRSLYAELHYASHIREVMTKIKPDVLHAHFAHPEGWAAYLAKKATHYNSPFIITLHGYDILTEPSCKYGIRLYPQYDALIRKVLSNADAIFVPSTAVYREAQKIVKIPNKLHLIHNGVDLNKFHPSLSGRKIRDHYNLHDKFVVFTARHHRCVYGLEYLVKSVPTVTKRRRDIIYIIGGDGPLRPRLENLVKSLGVERYVIFTGYIPRDQLPYYYAASDVVVVPSLQESWSLVATEAMATGKPVIATKVGGLPDQIIDGYNGFLVPPRDPEAIAQKILYLVENPEKSREMGKNARQVVEEKFNIEKRIDKIIEIYQQLSKK